MIYIYTGSFNIFMFFTEHNEFMFMLYSWIGALILKAFVIPKLNQKVLKVNTAAYSTVATGRISDDPYK